MTARRKARKRALDLLYEADIRGVDPREIAVERFPESSEDYAAVLVEGVAAHRERIDELLDTHSLGWTVERMPAVDRTLLRMAVFEMLWNDDVPDSVAISEAVELATSLSTDDSPGFINGLLGRIDEVKPRIVV
ncbi:MAG: transcription antitermination factor NusB [Actinobacteria bacterium]|nr:transcription antitermination factor NusB [Actinomycetota bacterium]